MAIQNKDIHVQIEELLKAKITNGEWRPGSIISSENEIAKQFNVSRMTARTAVTHLVNLGLLYRIPGKGTFVSQPIVINKKSSFKDLKKVFQCEGVELKTELISFEVIPATYKLADIFRVEFQAQLYSISQLYTVDKKPLAMKKCIIRIDTYPNLHLLYKNKLDPCHYIINISSNDSNCNETLSSISSSSQQAAILDIQAGHPLLLLTSEYFSDNEEINIYSEIFFRGDRIMLAYSWS